MNIPFPPGGHRESRRGRGSAFGGPFSGPFVPGFGPDAPPPTTSPSDPPRGPEGFGLPGYGAGPGGFGPGAFGPGGFPGAFGPGGFSRGWGPGRHGHRGRGRGGGRGVRRGNVRAAVLALLMEEPRHGYALMTEIAERSGGLWRPSPGSVYPVLQQLQDEGLVSVEEADGRRVFSLTDAGRTYVAEHPEEGQEPWSVAGSGPAERVQSIMFALQGLGAAADQVARTGDDAQSEQAVAAIDTARRALYRILAGGPG